MRLFRFISVITLTTALLTGVSAQDKLGHLKDWVGKYPTYNNAKPRREFLKLPEVCEPLLNLLSKRDYRFLTVICGKEVPIEIIENYLIVRKCHSNYCLRGTAVLVINIKDGSMHVAIRNENDPEPRWFTTNGKYKDLPFRLEAGYFVVKNGD